MLTAIPHMNVQAQGPTDYVAYWDFDEGTGSLAADASANGNDGTLVNANWADGISGQAVRFDGSGDYVLVQDKPELNFGTDARFAISLWARSTGSDGEQVLFSKRNVTGYQANFTAGEAFFFVDEGATHTQVDFDFPFDNNWHHLVFQREANRLSAWIDGLLYDTQPDNTLTDLTNDKELYIGSSGVRNSAAVTGRIDDFRMFNRALTATEVLDIYDEMVKPSAPRDLVATRGNQQVTLDWYAPLSDGTSAITNYRIYRGTSSGHTNYYDEVGNVLTYTDTGLTNGQTYYYTVTAVNANGEGLSSVEVSATPDVTPSAPRNLVATAGDGQIQLNWQAPASNGGSPITNYTIYKGTDPGATSLHVELGNVLSYNDGGLSSGQLYFYRVSATNAYGEGLLSGEVSATPFGPPSAPTVFQVRAGSGYVYLSWDVPVADGGAAVTNYVVYRGNAPGSGTVLANAGNVLWYNDTTVVNNQTYYYAVAAVNANGEGVETSWTAATPGIIAEPEDEGGFPVAYALLAIVLIIVVLVLIILLTRKKEGDTQQPVQWQDEEPRLEPTIPLQYQVPEAEEEPGPEALEEPAPEAEDKPAVEAWDEPPTEEGPS